MNSYILNLYGNSSDYRYGMQGQEMDNEIKREGNRLNTKSCGLDKKDRTLLLKLLCPQIPY